MKKQTPSRIRPGETLPRKRWLTLLRTGVSVGENRFARKVSLAWLSVYAGDLEVRHIHAQALAQAGRISAAMEVLEDLCQKDPEFTAAQELLATCQVEAGLSAVQKSNEILWVLGKAEGKLRAAPEWAAELLDARIALHAKDFDRAETLAQRAIAAGTNTALAGVIHLRVLSARSDLPPIAMRNLAEHYLARWPKCLQFTLFQASAWMDGGEPEKAVALLHEASAADIAGQVPSRLWGRNHPYRSLWPDNLSLPLEIPIPATIAAVLGWNQLPGPIDSEQVDEPAPAESLQVVESIETDLDTPPARRSLRELFSGKSRAPQEGRGGDPGPDGDAPEDAEVEPPVDELETESIISFQQELDRVAARLKKPDLSSLDGRFPVYVVFSTRKGLETHHSPERLEEIHQELNRLVAVLSEKPKWDALLLYGDDPSSTAAFGIKPGLPDDPWALKLVIADLDEALKRQGKMIGALLIVGGPQVVPFHHLPNPVDDDDPDVPSDNPYATRDENYFIPEWPVGRLPGSAEWNADALLTSLGSIIEAHTRRSDPEPWYRVLFEWILNLFWPYPAQVRQSFGYTAAVWRKASLSVFRPIGEARTMLTSPPSNADHLAWNGMTHSRLGYYNLHGLIDSTDWYGQRDPNELDDGPDYPIALRPNDVLNSGSAPQLVFSEACFGSHIFDKTVDQALALKFMSAGTLGMVGCTCTAYGSIAPPLIAADLLGHAFWKNLRDGHAVGEALRRAKVHLAQSMHQRQGYLDGEDQKTLISFVLYGDPLARAENHKRIQKGILRTRKPAAEIKTVCDRAPEPGLQADIPAEVLVHVKRVVAQYLPGMSDAEIQFSQEAANCNGVGHQCPTSQLKPKSGFAGKPDRQVVILRKHVRKNAQVHPHYARLTLDPRGKVIKLAVSR